MSFDKDAESSGIAGADLKMLTEIHSRICATANPALRDEIGRRLIQLLRSGLRDAGLLAALAANPGKPARKADANRTLQGEAGIASTNEM
jgi:hypothetical protein